MRVIIARAVFNFHDDGLRSVHRNGPIKFTAVIGQRESIHGACKRISKLPLNRVERIHLNRFESFETLAKKSYIFLKKIIFHHAS